MSFFPVVSDTQSLNSGGLTTVDAVEHQEKKPGPNRSKPGPSCSRAPTLQKEGVKTISIDRS